MGSAIVRSSIQYRSIMSILTMADEDNTRDHQQHTAEATAL
jgi:hypothetical protein